LFIIAISGNKVIKGWIKLTSTTFIIIIILWAGVQPTLDPYAEALIAGPLR